ncbi:MAG: HAD-IIB family hydrolase [Myxococcota bacterium]
MKELQAGGPISSLWCDIDDTLTDRGRLGVAAYQALWRLHEGKVLIVPVTGRPAGWCDLVARQWPVYGVVGENGALFYRFDPGARRMNRRFVEGAQRPPIAALLRALRLEVPRARVAADQPFRQFDLAIDFAEDVGPLSAEEVERIVALFERYGAQAKVSSIHVNGWWGVWDKMQMIRRVIADDQLDPGGAVYVGDSPNDQPAFAGFDRSVGVANVEDFRWAPGQGPVWRTQARGGVGFAELAEAILEANENLRASPSLR